jgi:predicted ATPase
MTLHRALVLHHFLREAQWVQTYSEEMTALCMKYGFSQYLATGMMYKGWLLARQGDWAEGITQIRQYLAAQMDAGRRINMSYDLALLSEAYSMAGEYTKALATLHESLAIVEQTGECFWQAEALRLKGEVLLAHGAPVHEVESCYLHAVKIARRQNAKSLDLRAVMSLARLWQNQNKQTAAQQMLSANYGWFTEGFDTPDLQEAHALLEALS